MVGWKNQQGLLNNLALIQRYVSSLIHLSVGFIFLERALALAF